MSLELATVELTKAEIDSLSAASAVESRPTPAFLWISWTLYALGVAVITAGIGTALYVLVRDAAAAPCLAYLVSVAFSTLAFLLIRPPWAVGAFLYTARIYIALTLAALTGALTGAVSHDWPVGIVNALPWAASGVLFFRGHRKFVCLMAKLAMQVHEAAADGRADVIRVKAAAIALVDDLDDWGPYLLFDVGDGQLLYLADGFFDLDGGERPKRSFEIRLSHRHHLFLGIAKARGAMRIRRYRGSADHFPGELRSGDILAGSLPIADVDALSRQGPLRNIFHAML